MKPGSQEDKKNEKARIQKPGSQEARKIRSQEVTKPVRGPARPPLKKVKKNRSYSPDEAASAPRQFAGLVLADVV